MFPNSPQTSICQVNLEYLKQGYLLNTRGMAEIFKNKKRKLYFLKHNSAARERFTEHTWLPGQPKKMVIR